MTVKITKPSVVTITTKNGFIDFDFSMNYIDIKMYLKPDGDMMGLYDVRREDLMKVVSLMLQYDRMKSRPQGQ
jgi:hypothetical protein